MPFFHMQSTGVSHESSLHFKTSQMDQSQLVTPISEVQVAPYHPSTPTFTYTYARYYDRMRLVETMSR